MGECIIGRIGGGEDLTISNETKSAIGVSNDATLDEIIKILGLQTDSYATIIARLRWPDNTPVINERIKMMDIGGANLIYTTDNAGQCIFKTNNQSANFTDYDAGAYVDVDPANTITVDAPVGMVKTIDLIRSINSINKNININRTIKFSHLTESVDVTLNGGDGASGYPSYGTYDRRMYINSNGGWTFNALYIGGHGNSGNRNELTEFVPTAYQEIEINIGLSKGNTYTVGKEDAVLSSSSGGETSFSATFIAPYSGDSGGTSKFGTYLSASGGKGGESANGENNASDIYSGGGIPDTKCHYRTGVLYYSGNGRWRCTGEAWLSSFAGSKGYCWLNNFNIKSF